MRRRVWDGVAQLFAVELAFHGEALAVPATRLDICPHSEVVTKPGACIGCSRRLGVGQATVLIDRLLLDRGYGDGGVRVGIAVEGDGPNEYIGIGF